MVSASNSAGGEAPQARRRVMVLDDERGPRESLRILLKPFYDVIAVDSVKAALAALAEQSPDLIISDIRMPDRSGIQGLGDIRQLDSDVCVFMLTGYGDLDTAREAIRMGADDYIRKPFDTKEMLGLVKDGVQKTEVRRKARREQKNMEELAEKLRSDMSTHARMAALGMASSEMIHDIRNPLTIIMGYADLLQEELAEGKAAESGAIEYIQTIRDNLKNCTEIMENWRALGKRTPHSIQSIPLKPFLEDVARAACGPRATTHPTVGFAEADRDAHISGDRIQLRRAFQNIVQNAMQAIPETGGEVTVLVRRTGPVVDIRIRDNGCGIPVEQLERVFDAFYTTKGSEHGTGLGLFITKQVIEDHGGQISIQSRTGEGTTVRIQLPCGEGDAGSHG